MYVVCGAQFQKKGEKRAVPMSFFDAAGRGTSHKARREGVERHFQSETSLMEMF